MLCRSLPHCLAKVTVTAPAPAGQEKGRRVRLVCLWYWIIIIIIGYSLVPYQVPRWEAPLPLLHHHYYYYYSTIRYGLLSKLKRVVVNELEKCFHSEKYFCMMYSTNEWMNEWTNEWMNEWRRSKKEVRKATIFYSTLLLLVVLLF